ncbi:Protein CBR-IKB-1 [Caenorhabditis briggsae]|uniref:Protein CBR-IKB-1 n=1 Tax=Caenorhabditis briggsae TaxID=6238 RepID=A8WWP2_CAEBR|nr:Protein CBR-IKB-1 [Caenorhabditis briggsae]CAP24607.2 Protein CBR-IKB-1 [Caenorhabditis briggsae]
MPSADENKTCYENNDIQKSKSDTEINSTTNKESSNQYHRIFIEEFSSCEGFAGDRVWATYSGAGKIADTKPKINKLFIGDITEPLNIHFLGENLEESAVDVVEKHSLVTFTVPVLPIEAELELEIRFSTSDDNVTTIPFKYLPRARLQHSTTQDVSLFDRLLEFATTEIQFRFFSHSFHKLRNMMSKEIPKNGQSFSLKLLLSVLPNSLKEEVINVQNNHGLTSLHCAIRAGDPDAVHYLMNHGAKINISDHHGNTVLHYLGDAYNESIFKEVLEPTRGQRFDINQLNSEGFAPIHVAVRRLKLSLIEMLLEAGALIDFLDTEKKRNALMHAIEMNDFETIQLLVERGSNTNIEDALGETSLSLAVKNVNYPVIGLLLDNGADPNRQNCKGVCLADNEDSVVQNIINGDRPELPKKEGFNAPNDLAVSRSPLFGRSHPDQAPTEDSLRNRLVKRSREAIMNDAETLLEETDSITPRVTRVSISESDDEQPGPSTSTTRSQRRRTEWERNPKLSDSVCNLDYLTRIRVSKIFDDQCKWQTLAQQLDCDHMIELISICSAGDDSSPTMILLDQFEQLQDSSISRLRDGMSRMNEESAVKLIDSRYVY